MYNTSLEKHELNRLFQAVKSFNAIEPWSLIDDVDLFAIEYPETEENIYCCIMGSFGECFGLAMYIGDVGLNSYLDILAGRYEGDPELLQMQNCILLTLEDREDIDKEDYDLIKSSDIRFRGRKKWPMIRKFEPGYYPWFLDDRELKLITIVLEQVNDIALKVKESGYNFMPISSGVCETRMFKNGRWINRRTKLNPRAEEFNIPLWKDELRLRNLRKRYKKIDCIWEIDRFYSPTLVENNEKPYYPVALIVVDGKTGMINGMHMTKKENCYKEFQEYFINMIEEMGTIPSKIVVCKEDVHKAFNDMFKKLGIEAALVEELYIVPYVKEDMYRLFD